MLIAGVEYVTITQAAAELDVDQALIRDWQRRGLVAPVAKVRGRNVYALADLWDVERNTRNRSRPRGA